MKKERDEENVKELVQNLLKITNTKMESVPLVVVDSNDETVRSLVMSMEWKKNAKVLTLNQMGLASVDVIRTTLEKASSIRALLVSTSSTKDAVAVMFSNNQKDLKHSKYVLGKYNIARGCDSYPHRHQLRENL